MRASLVGLVFFLAAPNPGCSCGSAVPRHPTDGGPIDGAARLDAAVDAPHPCVGLACDIPRCDAGGTTSLTGTVYTPAGDLPLYNVIVYVPNAPVQPFQDVLECARCDAALSGAPIVQTTTDTHGQFVLNGVPAGSDVPLVIQIGRWRRQITVPTVASCTSNAVDASLTRLPRNHTEGDIPRIALTTGGADALECLLRKIGIDDSEITTETGGGRVHLYAGHGGADRIATPAARMSDAPTLWDSVDTLSHYDVVLLSCEGGFDVGNKSAAALQAMQDYTTMGGRVFASHWHNYWVERGPAPFPTVATFDHQPDLHDPFTGLIDTSFPKGQALSDWLVNVGGSTTPGQVTIHAAQHTVDATNPAVAQRWVYGESPASVQYFTFNTPVGAAAADQCGRFVVSDIHVSSGDSSSTDQPFPMGCTSHGLTPQEKVLVFMLFDLSACLTADQPF